MDDGLTTIDEARIDFSLAYKFDVSVLTKIQLKCWLNHSESRNRNGNKPFSLSNYIRHINTSLCLEQVRLNLIDCEDIGGRDSIIQLLENRLANGFR